MWIYTKSNITSVVVQFHEICEIKIYTNRSNRINLIFLLLFCIIFSCIKGYEVETAGSWDRDAEFKIFTNISQEKRCLKTDLRKGQCDVMEVLWYFNNKMLGMDTMSKEDYLPLGNIIIMLCTLIKNKRNMLDGMTIVKCFKICHTFGI